MTNLTCPRCRGMMQTYQRAGVTVDQCTQCRGIFLDHGELEHIMNAEKSWTAQQYPQQPYPQQGYPQQAPPPPAAPGYVAPVPAPYPAQHGAPGAPGYYGHRRGGAHGGGHGGYYGHRRGGHGGYYGHGRHGRKSFMQQLFD